MLNNMDYVLNQYDLIYGKLPEINNGDNFSKEMLLVDDVDSKEYLSKLFDEMYNELTAPKKKK